MPAPPATICHHEVQPAEPDDRGDSRAAGAGRIVFRAGADISRNRYPPADGFDRACLDEESFTPGLMNFSTREWKRLSAATDPRRRVDPGRSHGG